MGLNRCAQRMSPLQVDSLADSSATRNICRLYHARSVPNTEEMTDLKASSNKDQVLVRWKLSDVLNKQQDAKYPSQKTNHKGPSDKSPGKSFVKKPQGSLIKKSSKARIPQQGPEKPKRAALIHVFRALLRQCTYLPDPAARKYLHSYIVSRFHKARRRATRSKPFLQKGQTPLSLLKTARKALLYLHRANAGHPQHLSKVLAMTYGRIGKRRHELLDILKTPSNGDPADKGEHTANCHPLPPVKDVSNITPQFAALMRSQINRKATIFSRQPLKRLQPVIPEKNAWGRPMPLRRVKNIKKRWYAEALDRTMPPLPLDERERLRRLALGEEQWEGPVLRRKGGSGDGKIARRPHMTDKGMSRPHVITPRFMRRLWGKLLSQCPGVRHNEAKRDGQEVLWTDVQKTRAVGLQPSSEGRMAMFAGVDEKGKTHR
ncbi:MAG: hypothetical protein Q9217_002508 [Psora testacea]